MKSATTSLLEDAVKVLSDPARWTKHCSARDSTTRPLDSAWDKDAVCWCVSGMVWKLAHDRFPSQMEPEASDKRLLAYDAMREIRRNIRDGYTGHIGDWNDAEDTDHHHVIAVLGQAVKSSQIATDKIERFNSTQKEA